MAIVEGVLLSAGAITFLKELGISLFQNAAYEGIKNVSTLIDTFTKGESKELKGYIDTYLDYQRRTIEDFSSVRELLY